MAGVVKMKKTTEIIKIIEKVESMASIAKVSIKSDDLEIKIEKAPVTGARPTSSSPTTNGIEVPAFEVASARKKSAPGMASPFQVKYARDLMLKIFGADDRQALDFLAHTLAVPMNEVPDIESWDDTLTVDMVSSIIDGLQPMYKGKAKGGF